MPTPQETFGFGAVPLTSYFGLPQRGSADTRFSPQARGLLQQEENYQKYQRQQEADQLVNTLLGGAAQMTDAQINEQLVANPAAFQSRDLGALQGYQQFRQRVGPTPFSDEQLGPYFLSQIQNSKDPRHAQASQRRMLDEGYSANEAWDAYRMDEFDDPLAQELAEAGVDRAIFDSLKDQSGYFDSVEVRRRVSQAKAEKTARRGSDVLDDEMDILGDVLTRTDKAIENAAATGTTREALDALKTKRQIYADRLDAVTAEKLAKLRPPASPESVAPTVKTSSFLNRALGISQIPVTPPVDQKAVDLATQAAKEALKQ